MPDTAATIDIIPIMGMTIIIHMGFTILLLGMVATNGTAGGIADDGYAGIS